MSLIAGQDVSVSFGATAVLRGVDVALGAGEVVGLIGPNGAGKTTLLRVLAGLLAPDTGAVTVQGQSLAALDRTVLARTVAYLPQAGPVHWAVTVAALVMMGRLPHLGRWRGPGESDHAAVERALTACDVDHLRDRPMTTLSGGERARALLARALAVEPKLLLADEPVAGLDPAHQLDVMARLRRLAETGAGVIVVLHDLTHAARYCDRLAVLHDRGIAAAGLPADVMVPEILDRCFGVRAYHAVIDGRPVVLPLERTPGADEGRGTP